MNLLIILFGFLIGSTLCIISLYDSGTTRLLVWVVSLVCLLFNTLTYEQILFIISIGFNGALIDRVLKKINKDIIDKYYKDL